MIFDAKIKKLIAENRTHEALSIIKETLCLVDDKTKDIVNNFVDTKNIDDLCQEIGAKIIMNDEEISSLCQQPIDQNLNVYISGALFFKGGHTREIEDCITHTYADRRNIIILSAPSNESDPEQLAKLAALNIEVIFNDHAADKTDLVRWLQKKLAELRPNAIFVSSTLYDVIALSALQPKLINKLYWNLSLDHGISTGIHIPSITKIIVKRPYLYFYLQEKLKISKLVYVPFNRPDIIGKLDSYVSDDKNKKIITASCTSSPHKISSNYKHRFIDVIPNILKITQGKHIHIGVIFAEDLAEIYLKMEELGIEKDRFILVNFTESLAKFLIDNDVDILLQTFPVGGGLVSVEAMEAGKMIINHKNYRSYLFNISDFCYDDAFKWQEPEDLYNFFRNLTREEIIRNSKLSRQYYEKYNCSKNLKEFCNVDDFIGVNIEDKKSLIAQNYNYALDFFQKSFDNLKNIENENKKYLNENRHLIEAQYLQTLNQEFIMIPKSPKKKTFSKKFKASFKKRITKIKNLFAQ